MRSGNRRTQFQKIMAALAGCVIFAGGCDTFTGNNKTWDKGISSDYPAVGPRGAVSDDTGLPMQPGQSGQSAQSFQPGQVVTPAQAAAANPNAADISAPIESPRIQKMVDSFDPADIAPPRVNLSIYQYRVAAGSISNNEAFWKRIDESAVNPATHDILDRNGLRVGIVSFNEFASVMAFMQKGSASPKPAVYAAAGVQTLEIPMKRLVPYQVLYHFGPSGEMPIRSYDDAENILCVRFEPARRKPSQTSVTLVPMVRSLRKQLLAMGPIETKEITTISPEKFFDLNLAADVPLDGMLVIAPSAEARSRMSLGNAFLVDEGEVGLEETVVLLIPQANQVNLGNAAPAKE